MSHTFGEVAAAGARHCRAPTIDHYLEAS